MKKKKFLQKTMNSKPGLHRHGLQKYNSQVLSEAEKIELYSEDVQEIMGRPPHWIVRRGITVIFLVVLFIFAGGFVFKYPDVIDGSVLILSENPPVTIVTHTTGKIDQLLVHDTQFVDAGEYLAIIDNTANHRHVAELSNIKAQLGPRFISKDFAGLISLPDSFVLGPVQASFSNFQRHYNEFRDYFELDLTGKKIASVRQQIKDYETYLNNLKNQVNNQKAVVNLGYRQYQRDSLLYTEKVIAMVDMEKSEQAFIRQQSTFQDLLGSLSGTEMDINQLRYQVIDLESQRLDESGRLLSKLKASYDNLQTAVSEWIKTYVLISPIAGRVVFTDFWSQNQFVSVSDQVFTIVPLGAQNIIGRVKIPTKGSGKVAIGQRVLIQLDNFPPSEYGLVEGKIASISLMPLSSPEGAFYTSRIALPDGLVTNFGKQLAFNQQMQGQVQIITQKVSVMERFISPLKYIFKKSI